VSSSVSGDTFRLWITYRILPPEDGPDAGPVARPAAEDTPRREVFEFPASSMEQQRMPDGTIRYSGPSLGEMDRAVAERLGPGHEAVILRTESWEG